MKYKDIGLAAPRLAEMGFTHVQFPPIQTTRTLTVLDIELLQGQLRARDQQLRKFETLCLQAKEKARLYTPHQFDHLLLQRMYYIRQPAFRAAHALLLQGKSIKTLAKHAYHNELSPVAVLIADILGTGTKHPHYGLVEALECVIKYNPVSVDSNIYRRLHELERQYRALQPLVQEKRTPERIAAIKQNKKEYSQLLQVIRQAKQQDTLMSRLTYLEPYTRQILNEIPSKPALPTNPTIPLEHWFDLIFLAELLVYPPWWLIYQPLEQAVGNTFLGTQDEIREAIDACRKCGLAVIADVVLNNLAAVAGERSTWLHCKSMSGSTMKDVAAGCPPQALRKIQTLLQDAFGSSDLSILTAPKDCVKGREPTDCWMSLALPQLNQTHPLVQARRKAFLNELGGMGVSGIRMDAAAHLTPAVCSQSLNQFEGLSYIEYVGGSESWRKYPAESYEVRKEDFSIGEDLYAGIFSEQANYPRLKNWGSLRLHRDDLDSVVMIVNHDHIMGSIPSKVFSNLPSELTYEMSLVYLIQRMYGHVLLMPHDVEFISVQRALLLRKHMKEAKIVREYVWIHPNNHIMVEKYNMDGLVFVVAINASLVLMHTPFGDVPPYSFEWFRVGLVDWVDIIKPVYSNIRNAWRPVKPQPTRKSIRRKPL